MILLQYGMNEISIIESNFSSASHLFSPFSLRLGLCFMLGNDVTPVQAKELRSLLQCSHMSSLKELLLDDNELESEGAITIAEAVKV